MSDTLQGSLKLISGKVHVLNDGCWCLVERPQQKIVKEKKQMILTARIGEGYDSYYETSNRNSNVRGGGEGFTLTHLERAERDLMLIGQTISLDLDEALELFAAMKLFFGENK